MIKRELIHKYDVAAPRYTSYPTVPLWDVDGFSESEWQTRVLSQFRAHGSRGLSIYIHLPFCESLCTYCGCNVRITKNHEVEHPYIMALLKEWELYKKVLSQAGKPIRIEEIHLGGGTPTFFSVENLIGLIRGITAGVIVDQNVRFSFEGHPANTTVKHLQGLYNVGFRRFSLGIQDFDIQVQKVINRRQTVEEVARLMFEARRIGYESINFDLIYGLPLQTSSSVERTVESVLELEPDRISFYSYAHVPWIKPGQRHYTELDLPTGQNKQNLYLLGKKMIECAGYSHIGMDHFAKPADSLCTAEKQGTLHRNFMGYTDRFTPLLIGLGVSSISDSVTAFAQNVKNVEDYYALLNSDNFPVFKGHLLDQQDQQIRQYVLDIMCRGRMQWGRHDGQREQVRSRLAPLITDGLVRESENGIQVTNSGRSFLRNICMAFDVRLHRSSPQRDLFSQAI
ncbi:MAG TPA: oxygen-independent coproporphyrinogen III oxidase [Candidatus Sphingobacterium stercorigallinarum]|nr:oxygen-independent coproporphyrinogen III oxidase [Candidatus Sphingobacterium stercorigallinarum]